MASGNLVGVDSVPINMPGSGPSAANATAVTGNQSLGGGSGVGLGFSMTELFNAVIIGLIVFAVIALIKKA